jgi:hypothetical protein
MVELVSRGLPGRPPRFTKAIYQLIIPFAAHGQDLPRPAQR